MSVKKEPLKESVRPLAHHSIFYLLYLISLTFSDLSVCFPPSSLDLLSFVSPSLPLHLFLIIPPALFLFLFATACQPSAYGPFECARV